MHFLNPKAFTVFHLVISPSKLGPTPPTIKIPTWCQLSMCNFIHLWAKIFKIIIRTTAYSQFSVRTFSEYLSNWPLHSSSGNSKTEYSSTVLYFWYHWCLFGVRSTLDGHAHCNLVLHHQCVDNDGNKAERCQEAGDDDKTVGPTKHICVPVGHPCSIQANHHTKDCHRCADARRYTHTHTAVT